MLGQRKAASLDAYGINTYSEYGIYWGNEVFNYPPEKDPLIDNLIYENDCICISSQPKIGKSLLAQQLMLNLTTASSFLDTLKVHKRCNVLYVQTEGDRSETIDRLSRMRVGLTVDWSRVFHMNLNGIALNTPDGFATFCALAEKPKAQYDVIIIDPLYTTVKGSLTSDDVATDWIRNVRAFKGQHGAAVVVLNHDTKELLDHKGKKIERGNNQTFGSQMWLAFFNHNFVFKKRDGLHLLECGVQRSGKIIEKLEMKLMQDPLMFVNNAEAVNSRETRLIEVFRKHKRVTIQQVIEAGLSRSTAFRAVSDLARDGLIRKVVEDEKVYYEWKVV